MKVSRRAPSPFTTSGGRLAHRDELDRLLGQAAGGDAKQRADAINHLWGNLARLSSRQRDELAALCRGALSDDDANLRGQAICTLGDLHGPEDLDRLEAALTDPDWWPRLAAVTALSRAQPPVRVEAITRLRDDSELLVREAVADALDSLASSQTAAFLTATSDATHARRRRQEQPGWLRDEWTRFRKELPGLLRMGIGGGILLVAGLMLSGYGRLGEAVAWTTVCLTAAGPMLYLHGSLVQLRLRPSRFWALMALSYLWAGLVFGLAFVVFGLLDRLASTHFW